MLDPDSEYAFLRQNDAVAYESIASKQCLVLLGEPGMGKSVELRRMSAEEKRSSVIETAIVLYRDLREYESLADIQADIFESAETAGWRDGEGHLTLFLDSLDEALLSVEVIAARLPSMLRRYPVGRLSLRLACRTAEWPSGLSDALHEIWPDDDYGIYEIVPLRKADVRLAASDHGIDSEAFLSAVRDRDIAAFASKPNTLNLLLDLYGSTGGDLPRSQAMLYQQGLLHMCEGHDADGERRASRRSGRHSANERFAIATRMAAVTILGNRAAVWQGVRAETPGTDTAIAALAGGTEPVGQDTVRVDEESVRDVLANTGLFSSRGSRRMGWAHQTYAEYLAATWIVRHAMPLGQIEGLIRHPGDRERRFIPQLHEMIAWLAVMDTWIRRLVHEVEPEILLRTDVQSLGEDDRRALIDALLRLEERGELPVPDYFTPRRYDRLNHSGIAEQLRPWITDPERHEGARDLALEIAGATTPGELSDVLAELALDGSQPQQLRVGAALIVARHGTKEAIDRMVLLTTADQSHDDVDDLRGIALGALWPDQINSETLFGALTKPKQPNHHGYYERFIQDLGCTLDGVSLVAALTWVRCNDWVADEFPELRYGIIRRAWDVADDPNVLQALAEEVAGDLVEFREWAGRDDQARAFADVVCADTDRRRQLLERIVKITTEFGYGISVRLIHGAPPLLLPNDFSWLLEKVSAVEDNTERERWSTLAIRDFSYESPEHLDLLYARRHEPVLADVVLHHLGPVEVDSAEAESARSHLRHMAELDARRAEWRERPLPPTPQERIAAGLKQHREGRTDAWTEIVHALFSSTDGKAVSSPGVRPSKTWVWDTLGETNRQELVAAACAYLIQSESNSEERLTYLQSGGWAAYRALILLLDEEPERLAGFRGEVWHRWTRAIVTASRTGETSTPEAYSLDHELLRKAYEANPEVVIADVVALLRSEDTEQHQLWSVEYFTSLNDPAFEAALLELAFSESLSPKSTGQLLSRLLQHGSSTVERRALEALPPSLPRRKEVRARALALAEALLIHGRDEGLTAAWRLVSRSKLASRDFALSVATRVLRNGLDRFDERQLGDLFTWLTELFPYPNPTYRGTHWVTAEDEVRRLRSACLTDLGNRATRASLAALEQMARRWPEVTWIKDVIRRVEAERRRRSWVPVPAEELLALAAGADRRFVASAGQLMDLVLESLERFEQELQGELPASANLWDEVGSGARPKDEEHLSDEIARHLRRDLAGRRLVVGREVQIRRPSRSAVSGQRTDIYVEALAQPPADPDILTLIIEVKGCWFPNVVGAMEKQLVGQYLARNPRCEHGLFVVGWYLCPRWIQENRKSISRRLKSLSDLLAKLRSQAASLTEANRRIEALVLDCAWHSDDVRGGTKGRAASGYGLG